jgi:hypothetical protein
MRSQAVGPILIGALVVGALAGYIDQHNEEVQATVLVLVVGMTVIGYLLPKWSWLAALIAGSCILAAALISRAMGIPERFPIEPNVFASLLAIIPAGIGALVGVAIRKATA